MGEACPALAHPAPALWRKRRPESLGLSRRHTCRVKDAIRGSPTDPSQTSSIPPNPQLAPPPQSLFGGSLLASLGRERNKTRRATKRWPGWERWGRTGGECRLIEGTRAPYHRPAQGRVVCIPRCQGLGPCVRAVGPLGPSLTQSPRRWSHCHSDGAQPVPGLLQASGGHRWSGQAPLFPALGYLNPLPGRSNRTRTKPEPGDSATPAQAPRPFPRGAQRGNPAPCHACPVAGSSTYR